MMLGPEAMKVFQSLARRADDYFIEEVEKMIKYRTIK